MAASGSNSNSLDEWLHSVQEQFDALAAVNFADLPMKVAHTVEEYSAIIWDQVTQGGTLPSPSLPSFSAKRVAPPPPPPTFMQTISLRVHKHPYASTALLASLPFAVVLVLKTAFPHLSARLHLGGFPSFLPANWNRFQLITQRPAKADDLTRLEAVLVLGAEPGSLGHAIALDLEKRGFVVIATASDCFQAREVEKSAQDYLKALVLDPTDVESANEFLRAFATTLSRRFPLHAPGDPFASPGKSLTLSGIINCLPINAHCSSAPLANYISPLEGQSLSSFSNTLNGTILATVAVLQGTFPLLRKSKSSNNAPLVLTCVPTTTSRIALPFMGAQNVADAAVVAAMETFAREFRCARASLSAEQERKEPDVRFVTLDVGFFAASGHAGAAEAADLPAHLWPVYGKALHWRSTAVNAEAGGGRPVNAARSSDVQVLLKKVNALLLGRQKGRKSVGAGAFTYRIASMLPTSMIDSYLAVQDMLAGVQSRRDGFAPSQPTPRPTRRSLPSPPTASNASGSGSARPPSSSRSSGPTDHSLASSVDSLPSLSQTHSQDGNNSIEPVLQSLASSQHSDSPLAGSAFVMAETED